MLRTIILSLAALALSAGPASAMTTNAMNTQSAVNSARNGLNNGSDRKVATRVEWKADGKRGTYLSIHKGDKTWRCFAEPNKGLSKGNRRDYNLTVAEVNYRCQYRTPLWVYPIMIFALVALIGLILMVRSIGRS